MSQIKLSLIENFSEDRPWDQAWINMLDNIHDQGYINDWGEITDEGVKKELKKVGGRWLPSSENVIFPNEKTYALWLLKWS